MLNKENYEIAKKNGVVDRFRGDEISRRIAKEYPLSAQIALLMDKDLKYAEWQQYQAFRQEVKNAVDEEIAAIEAEINHGA
ncbi:MAG: hypothetical protein J6J71_04530 [Prevotella sp.]|nr:hypothetical protein [Prevotella sp.]